MKKLGIIGGSGFEKIDNIEYIRDIYIDTDYGVPSSPFALYQLDNIELYVLRRHGLQHTIPPHKINYHANIDAFSQLNIDKIIAFATSGAIAYNYPIGSLILTTDAIDQTRSRINTFFESTIVTHIDMTEPFCKNLSDAILKAAKIANINIIRDGIAVCTEGPRLETAIEIKFYKSIGATTVGMTLFPELILAKERGICYNSIAIISNYATGISNEKIDINTVLKNTHTANDSIVKIITNITKYIDYPKTCACNKSLIGSVFNAK